jgi:RNA recognition motif-containing protein
LLGNKDEFNHLIAAGSYIFKGRKFFVKPFL